MTFPYKPASSGTVAKAGLLDIVLQEEGVARMRHRSATLPPAQHAERLDRGRRSKGWLPGSGVLRLLRRQLEPVGHSAVHLPHRSPVVDLHRGFGNADIAGNLFAQATARDLT